MSHEAPTQPPRTRKDKPLPTFNLTVESVSPMPTVRDKTEIYRTVNLKFNERAKAEVLIAEIQRQLDASPTALPSVSVDGRVTQ